jgi:hypothetical protein
MKKLYILLFAANLCFAQNLDLLNTNWQVTKVVGEIFPDQFPPPMPYQQITNFSSNPSTMSISFFNNVFSYVTYIGNDSFTVNSKACTLGEYFGNNGTEVNNFFGLLCGFFQTNGTYYYTVSNVGNEKTLKITNPTFQEIYFKSAILGTKENDLNRISVYPNPSSDVIKIEKLKPNSSVELIDSSGKLVRTISNIKSDKTEINIKNLATGIYYLKVDGQSVQKIIKK